MPWMGVPDFVDGSPKSTFFLVNKESQLLILNLHTVIWISFCGTKSFEFLLWHTVIWVSTYFFFKCLCVTKRNSNDFVPQKDIQMTVCKFKIKSWDSLSTKNRVNQKVLKELSGLTYLFHTPKFTITKKWIKEGTILTWHPVYC